MYPKTVLLVAAVVAVASLVGRGLAQDAGKSSDEKQSDAQAEGSRKVTAETAKSPLDFSMKNIDGTEVDLSKYRGDVVLIVNVASKCGLTPQYEQLQQLHEKYADKGLRILGFPANNFKEQEPGSDEQIKAFCTSKYHVGFDMFSKVSVAGDDMCELYKFLTSEKKNGKFAGAIQWNFTKFLVDRDGNVIARFEPRTRPDAPEVVEAVEEALKAKKPE